MEQSQMDVSTLRATLFALQDRNLDLEVTVATLRPEVSWLEQELSSQVCPPKFLLTLRTEVGALEDKRSVLGATMRLLQEAISEKHEQHMATVEQLRRSLGEADTSRVNLEFELFMWAGRKNLTDGQRVRERAFLGCAPQPLLSEPTTYHSNINRRKRSEERRRSPNHFSTTATKKVVQRDSLLTENVNVASTSSWCDRYGQRISSRVQSFSDTMDALVQQRKNSAENSQNVWHDSIQEIRRQYDVVTADLCSIDDQLIHASSHLERNIETEGNRRQRKEMLLKEYQDLQDLFQGERRKHVELLAVSSVPKFGEAPIVSRRAR